MRQSDTNHARRNIESKHDIQMTRAYGRIIMPIE